LYLADENPIFLKGFSRYGREWPSR